MTDRQAGLYNEFCYAVYTTDRYLHRAYQRLLEPFSLTYLQYMVLTLVHERGITTLAAICTEMGLSNNTLTPVVQKLTAKGWIERNRCSQDSRQWHLRIPDSAAARLDDVQLTVGNGQLRFAESIGEPINDLIERQRELNAAIARFLESGGDEPEGAADKAPDRLVGQEIRR